MIKKLPKSLINALAAGEVVERPYSVVKELIENSFDANASEVKIDILKWWKKLIKVFDNWEWIKKEDLPLTIEEFATSKISSLEDLYNISTFGFRWEALATISEVSKFKIITKTLNDQIWWKLEKIQTNVNIQPVPVNFSHWTEVYVEDLFFNLPVRQKFLKSEQTEFKYIQNLVQNYAILNYDKWFLLTHNQKQIFHYKPQNDLIGRLKEVFPPEWEENYLFFEYFADKIKLYGVMGKSILKFNSPMIKIFANKRAIKDKIIQKAIMDAYSRWLEPGMYPFVILFLEVDPKLIDVNVHPRKEEVKFMDPWTIYNLVLNTLKEKLEQKEISTKASYVDFSKVLKNKKPTFTSQNSELNLKQVKQTQKLDLDFNSNFLDLTVEKNDEDIKIIGQIFDSYVLFTKWEDFYIMDQHAVAERIIFEKMRQEYNPEDISLLSVPLTFNFAFDAEKIEKIRKLWFDISEFWENKVIVYAVPKVIEKYKVDAVWLINSLLHSDIEDITINKVLEQVLATKSCKQAIKAWKKLSFEEMKQLIIDGQKYINGFFVCQHWRPSVVKLNKSDIDKFFDRK